MVSIIALWWPILVSAVFVFLASWIIHMFLTYHWSDFQKAPSEDELRASLRKFNLPQGEYMIPKCSGPKEMNDPELLEKMKEGPVAILTILESGPPKMGPSLLKWFLYCLLVSVLAAYIAGQTLAPGTHYLKVFQIAGCTAFIGYAIGLLQDSIWYGRKWSTTLKSMFDGLIYSLLTAGVFGWLWPGI